MADPAATSADQKPDLMDVIRQALTTKGGEANDAALRVMATMQAQLAQATTALDAERAKVRDLTGRVPTDGAVVLTGDEAKAYGALKGRDGYADAPLTKAAADLDQIPALRTENAGYKAKDTYTQAAAALGLNAAALLKGVPGLNLSEKEVNGAKVWYHTKADGAEVPVADFLASDYAELAPALKGTAAPAVTAPRPGSLPAQPAAVTPPAGTSGTDIVGAALAKFNAAAQPVPAAA